VRSTLDENQSSNVLRRNARSAHHPIQVKKVDFCVSAAYPISEVVSGNSGLHAELFALRNKSSLLHDGVALTYTRSP
jgi:hypothetical protein